MRLKCHLCFIYSRAVFVLCNYASGIVLPKQVTSYLLVWAIYLLFRAVFALSPLPYMEYVP